MMMGASSVTVLVFLLCLCTVKVESQRSFYKIPHPTIEEVSIPDENEDPTTLAHPIEEYVPSINFQYPPLPSLKEAQSYNHPSENQPSTTEQPQQSITPFLLPETRNVLQELLVNCSRENEDLLNQLMKLQEDTTYLANKLNSIEDINLHKLILSGNNGNTESAIMQVETVLREQLEIDNFNIVRAAVFNKNGSITFELNSLNNKLHVLRVAKEKLANTQFAIEDPLQTHNLETQHRYKRAIKIGGSSSTRSFSRPKSYSTRSYSRPKSIKISGSTSARSYSRSRPTNIGRSSSTRTNSGSSYKRTSKPTPTSKSSRFSKVANTLNTGLKPLGKVTNVLSASSNTAANIFNILHSSWLTASHVKANEAAIRANDMTSELSKFRANEAKEKKAYINKKAGELETKIMGLNRDIGYLKIEIKELKEKEKTDINEDRIDRKQIDINDKQQEILLLEKEIEYYKLIEI